MTRLSTVANTGRLMHISESFIGLTIPRKIYRRGAEKKYETQRTQRKGRGRSHSCARRALYLLVHFVSAVFEIYPLRLCASAVNLLSGRGLQPPEGLPGTLSAGLAGVPP